MTPVMFYDSASAHEGGGFGGLAGGSVKSIQLGNFFVDTLFDYADTLKFLHKHPAYH